MGGVYLSCLLFINISRENVCRGNRRKVIPDKDVLMLLLQVVMCSGVMADGSLRIVRNGIGMIEQATVELPGVKGMWSLRASYMDAFDTYLVLSFVGETRVLAINADDELDEAELPGFNAEAQVMLVLLYRKIIYREWCMHAQHIMLSILLAMLSNSQCSNGV